MCIRDSPGNLENHYLLHKTIVPRENQNSYMDLKYTYIDGLLNNGLGDVIAKNINILTPDTRLFASYSTAIQHENNLDWWIVHLEENNQLYVISLDADGFELIHEIPLETIFGEDSSAGGTAKFSSDGTKFTFHNFHDDLHIYDFDRGTGEMTNHRYLNVTDVRNFSALEWSPNSRFIYITTAIELWQVDTWEDDLEEGLILIDVWDGTLDPLWTLFHQMVQAPDCKIYMCSLSSTNTYHVINNPDAKGQDCDFVQQGIRLPFLSSISTMPNFPRYRVDEEDKCDPTITSIFGEDIYWRRDLSCYPNPVRDQLTVELPEQKRGQLVVVDMDGQVVMTREVYSGSDKFQLSLGGLTAGTYSVEYVPERNEERRVWTARVVKVD